MSDLSKLIHPFVKRNNKDNWTRFVNPRFGFHDNDVPGVKFGTGFLVSNQIDIMETPHMHEASSEFFVFTGADLDNIFESEFELDFFLGDSVNTMEVYKITKPTIVCVPPSVWHCPIYYKKVVRGTNTMILLSAPNWGKVLNRHDENGNDELYYESGFAKMCAKDPSINCTYCGICVSEEGKWRQTEQDFLDFLEPLYKCAPPHSGKYDKYVFELKEDYHKLGDAVMNPRAVFGGINDMDLAEHQFSFNIITQPVKLGDEEPVSNGQVAEFLWFSGTDVTDAWGSFDAEIEVMVGEDPDNMQKLTINEPAVITIPPGMWRGSINIKRVGKPLCFIPWYPHSKKRYKITKEIAGEKTLLAYNDETTIKIPTAGDELFLQMKR